MSFWESKPGAAVLVLILAVVLGGGVAAVRVHLVTHPERDAGGQIDFASMHVPVEAVRFPAVDGTELSGWLLESGDGGLPILLCHDLGSTKAELFNLALNLHSRGFTVLLFDFRGHGESAGNGSTLGIDEKRDILGALDYLVDREGIPSGRVGLYGVGMGAHAAVLAATVRPGLRVLVLDGLYPDASFPLSREVFAGWSPGMRNLSFVTDGLFNVMRPARIGEHRAAGALGGLIGRDVLLIAPEDDGVLTAEMYRMVESIPEQRDVDGNLVVLPATQGQGLYGKQMDLHHGQVLRFFEERLGADRLARRP